MIGARLSILAPGRRPVPSSRRDLASAPLIRDWALAALAPLLVAVCLLGARSVTTVFVAYHLIGCLAIPLLLARRNWPTRIGLTGPDTRRGLQLGALLALASAAIPPLAYAITPNLYPDPAHLRAVLSGWGIDPARPGLVLVFMALVNGPAEEILWRGYLQSRLLRGARSATVLALLFASYHVLTVGALAPGPAAAAIMIAGVVAATFFWIWTRRRWGSLWPALLSHAGATVGYTVVCQELLH